MLEFLFEVVGEFLLQAVIEILVELGVHSLAEPFRKRPSPWLAAFGYAVFGAAAGGLSLLVFPHHLTPEDWRIAHLLATPVAVGIGMMMLGRWRARRGDDVLRIDRFACGYLFALSLALVRYFFAG
ncbi:MAG: hypothetical protein JNM58_00570 [Xanthomonadaceae bacterium]|nr:hypothetical protein [Xanthomonadaceae bacterium]